MSKLPKPRTVVFDNFRLGPAVSYEKIVDRFGQYTRADWPGKAKSDADLKAQLAADKMEESIIQSLQQAVVLRQSILKKAFEGTLV